MKSILLKFLLYFGINLVLGVDEFIVLKDFSKTLTPITTDGKTFYQIQENALYSTDMARYFKGGSSIHSFECTFRLDPKKINQNTNFSLIHIQDKDKTFQLSINFILKYKVIKVEVKQNSANLIYKFRLNKTLNFLDGKWHSLMYAIHQVIRQPWLESWIDCKKLCYYDVKHEGNIKDHIVRVTKDLILTIGEVQNNNKNESIPIEISKMRFHGYSRMPNAARCEDLGKPINFTNFEDYDDETDEIYTEEYSTIKENLITPTDSVSTNKINADSDNSFSFIITFIAICSFITIAILMYKYY